MHVITTKNVHMALPVALDYLQNYGVPAQSRNGTVCYAPGPVTTQYNRPCERVMFWPERDANPFFHLFESLWMISGFNDVAYLAQFVPRMADFSDDGKTFHGAYGFRWREHFGADQLDVIISRLRADPTDRRSVLGMWDAGCDLGGGPGGVGKDLPCNLAAHFQVGPQGALNMTVFNRSNDIILGCYGANAVHFSFLQEYVAACVGVPVGIYWQVSNNWHAYQNNDYEKVKHLVALAPTPFKIPSHDPYGADYGSHQDYATVAPFPLISTSQRDWNLDLHLFMEDPMAEGFRDPFFLRIAKPMMAAHRAFKGIGLKSAGPVAQRCATGIEILDQMPAGNDWRLAAVEWLNRRMVRAQRATDGGVHAAQ